ncbi:LOW QUALITY PROTEIN: uncharacterized protein LOC122360307, partial [Puntigrus tetrazona]|uniref:LOW QUALITY PROTEIN: uncharacterized protein LOC122360307 n=1 Tax=Puntigrus tetrazona TaxID=1606681 RepID=UPI001C8A4FE5
MADNQGLKRKSKHSGDPSRFKRCAHSSSSEVDVDVVDDTPLHMPQYEELLEVVTRAALVIEQEIESLLRKEAIEVVPPQAAESGFYSCYFIVPKKDGGLRPILDLRVLNRSVNRLKFKMLTIKHVVTQIRSEDWFVNIDLIDAYFHISILPQHRKFLRFAFGGVAYQYRVLPFGLALSLRTFTHKCMDAALIPLRLQGIRILNYIDDWLGLMAAASNVIPFGLLYMRPLQWWLRTKGFSPRGNPLRKIKVSRRAVRALDLWRNPWFLNQGPRLGALCRRTSLATDASLTGWGAVLNGRPAHGLWSDHHQKWHINLLEMLAVFRALKHFLPDLKGHHVLVHTDNTAVVSYINHQGGLRSRPLNKLAHQILVWSQDKICSLRVTYIPGHLNTGADTLSRQGLRPGEWMLHPDVVKQIWSRFYQVEVFASRGNAQCPLWFSLVHPAPLGLDAMSQAWPRRRLYAFPPIALLPEVLARVRQDGIRLLLVAPFWPGRVWFTDLIGLVDGHPWEIPLRPDLLSLAEGTIVHPRPELLKLWVWPL